MATPPPGGPRSPSDAPPPPEGEVRSLWSQFIDRLRPLFLQPRKYRHQDQYLRPINAALELAGTTAVATEIESSYRKAVRNPDNQTRPGARAAEIVRMELEAFVLAVQVHETEEKAATAKPGAVSRLRTEAKTILRSVNDVFQPADIGKSAILVLIEALDLAADD
jgi:hypothetical protein